MCVCWNFPPDLGAGCHDPAVLTRCLLCLLSLLRHEILSSFSQIFHELCLLPAHTHSCTNNFPLCWWLSKKKHSSVRMWRCPEGLCETKEPFYNSFSARIHWTQWISLVLQHRSKGSSSCSDRGTRDTLVLESEARWITSGVGYYFRWCLVICRVLVLYMDFFSAEGERHFVEGKAKQQRNKHVVKTISSAFPHACKWQWGYFRRLAAGSLLKHLWHTIRAKPGKAWLWLPWGSWGDEGGDVCEP